MTVQYTVVGSRTEHSQNARQQIQEQRKAAGDRPPMRLRKNTNLEVLRGIVQAAVALLIADLFWSMVTLTLFGEWSHHLPIRLLEDTFRPVDQLVNLEPPLMNRTLYEQPGNIWRPIVAWAPEETYRGMLADFCWGVWNWGILFVWQGNILAKLAAAAFCFYVALMAIRLSYVVLQIHFAGGLTEWHRHSPHTYEKAKYVYLGMMPESLLILEQLIMAREAFGRKLSAAVEAEIEAAHPDAL